MSISIFEKRVLSSDGVHELAGKVYVPTGKPRGLIQIVHGMVEYIDRYDRFMSDMAGDGYIVFGYDHLGHGKTAADVNELGFISHKDGWKRLIDDVTVFCDAVKEEYGDDLQYVLMGHSMGSFIVRLAALQDTYDKLIIMGTGGPKPESGVGLTIIKALRKLKGDRGISPTLEKLAFGSYNERFNEGDIYSWLTKNIDIRKKYAADPFCTFHFSVSAYEDLVHLQRNCNTKRWARSINRNKPVLLLSGTDDPVGDYGRGVRKVCDMLSEAGVPVRMHLYENCRHEILNDTCYDEVLKEIRSYISE